MRNEIEVTRDQHEVGSPFWATITLLKISGIWPLASGVMRYIYPIYRAVAFTALFWMIVGEFGAVIHNWGDLNSVTLLVGLSSGAASGFAKAIIFNFRFPKINLLINDMNLLIKEQKQTKSNYVLQLLNQSETFAQKIGTVFAIFVFLVTVVWDTLPLIMTYFDRTGEHGLPVNTWFPYNTTASHGDKMTYIFQVVSLHMVGCSIVSVDILYYTFMILMTTQLQILCFNLSQLNCNEKKLKRAEQDGKEILNDHFVSLSDCIRHHQEIIRLVLNTEDVMNMMVLTQFLADLMMLCFSLFQSLETTSIHALLTNFLMAIGVVYHVFLFCWYAEKLTEQSEKVTLAAYDANWINASKEFKHSLIIIMTESQKPLTLTCGKFYVIRKATILSIVNAAYSYYAILSRINADKE